MPRADLGAAGLADFWRRVSSARRRVLALDYDGTLAPFRVERMEALPLPGVCALLERIVARGDTELVVVSGRAIDELEQLLAGAPAIPLIGSHGFEQRDARGARRTLELSAPQRAALDQADGLLRQRGEPALSIERKPASLALHTRGREAQHAERVEEEVLASWEQHLDAGFEARRFDGGVELRVAGVDKGKTLEAFLGDEQPGELVVYLGDDQTDEDAFVVVQARGGVGIKVGLGVGETTVASGRLEDCAAVRAMLAQWADLELEEGGDA